MNYWTFLRGIQFSGSRCGVGMRWQGSTCHGPKIQAGYRAIRAETAAVYLKALAADLFMAVDHAQPPVDGQIAKTEHIWPLERKQHEHFCRPHTNALKLAQRSAYAGIVHVA